MFSGLKCDSCDWKDMSVKYEEYPERVGSTCPECGDVVLTEKDFELCKSIVNTDSTFKRIVMTLGGFKKTDVVLEVIDEDK